jgi:hypothetical protein
MGVGGQHHAPAALPLGNRPSTHCTGGGWVGPSASLDGCGKSPTGIQSPDRTACSKYCNDFAIPAYIVSYGFVMCMYA